MSEVSRLLSAFSFRLVSSRVFSSFSALSCQLPLSARQGQFRQLMVISGSGLSVRAWVGCGSGSGSGVRFLFLSADRGSVGFG